MVFKDLIYINFRHYLLANVTEFSENGSDSMKKEETKRGFLTKEGITLLINGTFKKKSYELIRDLFIFCTFTGLSWTDM